MKAILKLIVPVLVAIAAICTFAPNGFALAVPGQNAWSLAPLAPVGIAEDRGVEKAATMRLARFGFGIGIGGGGIRFGGGYYGRGWGVSIGAPIIVPAPAAYRGTGHVYKKRRPYGYVEKCTTEDGVTNCSWVPKSMYWDWQSEGK